MKVQKVNKYVALIVGLYLLDSIFLLITNPNKLPLAMLVLPFFLMFITIFATTYGLLFYLLWRHASRKRVIGLSLLVAALPVLLALFESVHQLTAKDVALSLAITIAMGFYLTRVNFL